MNQFTKEELAMMLNEIIFYMSEHGGNKKYQALRTKLKSMIDKYCEHEMLESASNPRCVKCGVYP